jgi:hypothetical protein
MGATASDGNAMEPPKKPYSAADKLSCIDGVAAVPKKSRDGKQAGSDFEKSPDGKKAGSDFEKSPDGKKAEKDFEKSPDGKKAGKGKNVGLEKSPKRKKSSMAKPAANPQKAPSGSSKDVAEKLASSFESPAKKLARTTDDFLGRGEDDILEEAMNKKNGKESVPTALWTTSGVPENDWPALAKHLDPEYMPSKPQECGETYYHHMICFLGS